MPIGVRINPEHDERTRAKIQTSQIINRLEKHVKGEVKMTATQVRAADILLRKTLPDLQSVQYEFSNLPDKLGKSVALPATEEWLKQFVEKDEAPPKQTQPHERKYQRRTVSTQTEL